ncbi:MAG: DUF1343 domain-containing protein [Paludibacteraceae bacterium]|nr:DUF1343 domain-containing protein [Paludibacteraceae bacterium]
MRHLLSLLLCCQVLTACAAKPVSVKTGIEVLREQNFRLLEGKRVGLCTNPTGVDSRLKSTIDILNEAPNVNLVALFGPEHGVRGNIHAGDVIVSERDPKTGIIMYSLFGHNRKPTREMMDSIDIMVYDIQDIGCRSFTYISTLGNLMEACAECGKPLVVLDRPNPLGGEKIEGCLVEDGYCSFVSQFRIPYVYGLTCGELARLLNEEGLPTAEPRARAAAGRGKCDLTVVPMQGWRRSMTWEETGLPWVISSPHIPEAETAVFYPVTGIFGELGYLSIGVGYTLPFRLFAAEWVNADSLADAMNALQLPGTLFRPIHFNPYYAVGKGSTLQGVQIYFTDYRRARLSDVQFLLVQEMMRLWPEHDVFALCNRQRFSMFDKVCGTAEIRERFGRRYRWEDAAPYWQKDEAAFRRLAEKYWMYK